MKQKRNWMIISSILISLILLSSACSQSSNQDLGPADVPVPLSSEDLDSLILLAKFDLTLKTDVDLDQIKLESTEEFNFSDASLGVAEPGADYAQVITPGYIIKLKADGITYEYHASGERVVQVP
ncbi:MAG: hypothetical protein MUO54_16090 [Anaerolineales bacterium]|nr:hypothetical protein [Anaerolineales bacterium]